jgi:hypothetical protein
MRAESRFIRKIQAAENEAGNIRRATALPQPGPYSSLETLGNKGLYIQEYGNTGNDRSSGPRGSKRCDPYFVTACPQVARLGCGNSERKCQDNAATLANFRHTITAKKG